MAIGVNCKRARRVWLAEVAAEWPVVAALRWSCVLHRKLGCSDCIVDWAAAAAARRLEKNIQSAPKTTTCGSHPKGVREKKNNRRTVPLFRLALIVVAPPKV